MATDRYRLFFALFPPPSVRTALAEIQRRLGARARAVPPRQFHVTLAFLGSVPRVDVPGLCALAGRTPFAKVTLRFDRIGWFPRAGVGWVGVGEAPAPLRAFRESLNEALRLAGFRAESRSWQPHVTLYRKMRTPFAKLRIDPIDWSVESFALVASETRPEGVRYRVLERWE
ncbi:MAG: RNA 2',3'-cyclic phosphodiesterase [Gammaproteobacteria bacterium]